MIRFEGVHKSYGNVHALRGVDISVAEGEFTVLIGPSGCGKTTALKMVNRLITPTEGRVLVGGEDVAELDAVELRRNIGYVIQETGLFPHMTIAENIALVPRLKRWPKRRRDERVDELLHLVGLDPAHFRNRYPRHLSGGQRQRVGVARALAADPPIILMDEPFGATDPITRKQLQQELVRIKKQVRKTILFVTHDISEAFALADSICLLRAGKVVQHATPEMLLREPADEFVTEFIGEEAVLHELEYLRVEELADRRVVTVSASAPAEHVARALEREPARAALLVDERGKFAGVVAAVHFSANSISTLAARDLASLDPPRVRRGERVRECFPRLLQSDGADMVVVVDEADQPVGLIAYKDLVQLIARLSRAAPGLEAPSLPAPGQHAGSAERTASGRRAHPAPRPVTEQASPPEREPAPGVKGARGA